MSDKDQFGLPGTSSPIIPQEAPDGPSRTRKTPPLPPRDRSGRLEQSVHRHCLMDLCRLLHQEGWLDILEDFDAK